MLDRLLADPVVAAAVVADRTLPARPADMRPFPDWLDARLRSGLEGRGVTGLYSHQAEAIEVLRGGRDVCVVTPTASGKSLCYDLPVLQAVAEDASTRALYLFPTKALGQDQLAGFRELADAAGIDVAAAIYDGDTPAPIRQTVRAAGQVVVTNPDMLHAAILPHHTKWFQLFEQLRYVVVDEAHTYRGVFGSHVANVLRRLLRLCAHYGSAPRIVTCSATIGNPGQLAETLTGRAPVLVDRNGAPAGEKRVLILNPPVVDARLGVRGSACGWPSGRRDLPARRPPDDRLRPLPHQRGAAAHAAPRGAARGPRPGQAACAATGAATCPPSAGPSSAACAAARCSAW